MNELIKLSAISVKLQEQEILTDIDFTFYSNQIVTVVGPNGAGKTTLLKTLLGLIKPTKGNVWRKTGLTIGYVPQKLQLNSSLPLTVTRFLKLLPHVNTQQINQVMGEVGAPHILNRSMQTISGGELQRVLLARALLRKPELLVLDEPTQGIDINGQVELYQLISIVCKKYQCGVLMVSHDLNLVMANTDKVICLNKHICCSGHPAQVSNDPAFKELFGDFANSFAVYHHHHDHQHNLQGSIVNITQPPRDDCHHA